MTEGNCKKWGVEKEGLWGVTIDGDSKVLQGRSRRMQTLGHMPEELGAVFLRSVLVGE